MHTGDTTPSPPRSQRYWFDFEEKTNRLVGVVEPPTSIEEDTVTGDENNTPPSPPSPPSPPPPPPPPITLRSLHEHLKDEGYEHYFYLSNSVELFLKKIQRFETGRYPLAERHDAKISLSISSDKTTTRVQTDKSFGGDELTRDGIMSLITKAKIADLTFDKEKLNTLLTATEPVDLIIARAIPPKNGINGSLKSLIESKKLAERNANSDDVIDQNDVYAFTVVAPGDELMRRHPSTPGTDGLDVQGKVIRATPGVNMDFSKPFEGVDIDENDENLLIAVLKGHPIISKTGVKVDPIMTIDAVDIRSGHIDYDGSLMVKNNIEPGFKVKVSGDIFVKGSIIKATALAGGSITVTGGVNAEDIDDEHSCHLEAGGDVSAKYFHHASIQCKGDLHAAEYVMQCHIAADGFVNAGQERGRGCIIGGHCTSNSGVNAKVLGSEAYVTTVIHLGSDIELHEEVIRLMRLLKRRVYEEEQLSTILRKIQSSSKPTNVGRTRLDKERKIENTVELLRAKILELKEQLKELKSNIKVPDELAVKASDRIFPNVMISIIGHPWSSEETRRHCQVRLHDDRVSVENL